ncbi:hypothetical protein BP5796_07753 [Coleophoma crateriformis]|uniref:Uncharacterized protein n=1 Tax=Coleophoma crateriformis TaxID=565419 RepID=A0A3D8RCE9_9HELO|nr:hypothetical protein BP5796_07753 [Coleophoma crateriformis]
MLNVNTALAGLVLASISLVQAGEAVNVILPRQSTNLSLWPASESASSLSSERYCYQRVQQLDQGKWIDFQLERIYAIDLDSNLFPIPANTQYRLSANLVAHDWLSFFEYPKGQLNFGANVTSHNQHSNAPKLLALHSNSIGPDSKLLTNLTIDPVPFGHSNLPINPTTISLSNLPTFPSIEVPSVTPTFPSIQLPTFPSIQLPTFPSIQVPSVTPTLPSIQLPTFPSIQLPSVSPTFPSVQLPTISPTLPSIAISFPTLPSIQIPTFSVSVPPLSISIPSSFSIANPTILFGASNADPTMTFPAGPGSLSNNNGNPGFSLSTISIPTLSVVTPTFSLAFSIPTIPSISIPTITTVALSLQVPSGIPTLQISTFSVVALPTISLSVPSFTLPTISPLTIPQITPSAIVQTPTSLIPSLPVISPVISITPIGGIVRSSSGVLTYQFETDGNILYNYVPALIIGAALSGGSAATSGILTVSTGVYTKVFATGDTLSVDQDGLHFANTGAIPLPLSYVTALINSGGTLPSVTLKRTPESRIRRALFNRRAIAL